MPRGTDSVYSSKLPSARKVSLKLHHERDYPLGYILDGVTGQGSDPTCAPHNRFSTKEKEFNQFCPKSPDDTTAARLGGNGALVTHMVSKILAERCLQLLFEGDAIWSVCGSHIFYDSTTR